MSEQIGKTSISIGDLFEIDGRCRTFWTVEAITEVPRQGTFIRLSEIDGLGRVTLPATNLSILSGFRRRNEIELFNNLKP